MIKGAKYLTPKVQTLRHLENRAPRHETCRLLVLKAICNHPICSA
jgi:hypothetical protein